MCRALLWLLVGVGGLLGAQDQARAAPLAPESPLEAAIDDLVKKSGFTTDGPGVAILVHQPGKVFFQKGYGLANLRTRAPVTRQTRFDLASVSKMFTATALLILHERGRLSIHDDVRKYLPELPIYDAGRPIRIIDLLHHVSGLPEYLDCTSTRQAS